MANGNVPITTGIIGFCLVFLTTIGNAVGINRRLKTLETADFMTEKAHEKTCLLTKELMEKQFTAQEKQIDEIKSAQSAGFEGIHARLDIIFKP